MGLIYRRTDSGLVSAEHGQDEAAVARLLREIDPDLRLVPSFDLERRVHLYKVYRYAGSERPAQFLCAWMDADGVPLPLSSGLVEMVRSLARGRTVNPPDADALNTRKRLREERQAEADAQDAYDDHKRSARRSPVFHRGIHLRRPREGG